MNAFILHPALFLTAAALNIPLGYLRGEYAKLTFGWFFYTHLSIPVIIYLRTKAGFGADFIPVTLAGAVAGQFLGGLVVKKWNSAEND